MENQIPIPGISIRRYAIDVRDATVRDFDEKNKAQLDDTLAEINKIFAVKVIVVAKGCDFDLTGPRYDCFALTKSALDVLVSALHMARQRAVPEMFSLLRIAVESAGTALHIANSADAYELYKKAKYKSTAAVSFAKNAVPILGEIWGAFSNTSVHISRLGFGPRLERHENGHLIPSVVLQCDLRKHEQLQDKIALSFVSLVSTIVLKITELTLFHQSPLYEDWLRLAGTEFEYFSNTNERMMQYYEEIQSWTLQYAQQSATQYDGKQ